MGASVEGSAGARSRLDDTAPIPIVTGTAPTPVDADVVASADAEGADAEGAADPVTAEGEHSPEIAVVPAPVVGRHAAPSNPWRRVLRIGLEVGAVMLIALIASVFVRAFIAQVYYVPSASMEDTLMPGDRIVAMKAMTTLSGVSRGEVVVFHDPGGWLEGAGSTGSGMAGAVRSGLAFLGLSSANDDAVVKRVIAVGGDHIACCDDKGHIMLNGNALHENYLKPGVPTDQVTFDVLVPQGGLFVMGDNRADSRDSRYHLDVNQGAVPVADVIGRAVAVVWPPGRVARLPSLAP